jgi:hypothetical protein
MFSASAAEYQMGADYELDQLEAEMCMEAVDSESLNFEV